ncbi:PREDICTED: E3 ubiquitin-protein ligase Zswim2-like [Priapulus caudatus]|uniref:E3 ubiquitin-protein ligase Zswim2-like n=1 Tax=Priapulus caudatus TaxID=37621 RepID=A0ABM1E802_PRICU|nr:PREDICTED: E3 ubiquitin-protein ligase Zswim2-like [Priapulus caudatus]
MNLSFQRGLVEREITALLHECTIQTKNVKSSDAARHTDETASGQQILEQRDISQDDVCPICQEKLLAKHVPVTYCRFGCGNSIHIKCMKVWADHQKSTGEVRVHCPLCREDFGPLQYLEQELRNSGPLSRRNRLTAFKCRGCDIPITGTCYRCTVCSEYYACELCFLAQHHSEHDFTHRQKHNQRWRCAVRSSGAVLPPAVMENLSGRDLVEDDYDLLLQLASSQPGRLLTTEEVGRLSVSTTTARGHLLQPGMQCRVCLRPFLAGHRVRTLPCAHVFHKDCIDNWLQNERGACPVDGEVPTTHHAPRVPARMSENCQQPHKHRGTLQTTQQNTLAPCFTVSGCAMTRQLKDTRSTPRHLPRPEGGLSWPTMPGSDAAGADARHAAMTQSAPATVAHDDVSKPRLPGSSTATDLSGVRFSRFCWGERARARGVSGAGRVRRGRAAVRSDVTMSAPCWDDGLADMTVYASRVRADHTDVT